MPWPLVGRERELQAAGALLSDGRSGGVVLTGPAGVGKTRLAAEIDRLAVVFAPLAAVARRTGREPLHPRLHGRTAPCALTEHEHAAWLTR